MQPLVCFDSQQPHNPCYVSCIGAQDKIATIPDLIKEVNDDESATFDKLIEKLEYSYRKSGVGYLVSLEFQTHAVPDCEISATFQPICLFVLY